MGIRWRPELKNVEGQYMPHPEMDCEHQIEDELTFGLTMTTYDPELLFLQLSDASFNLEICKM